MRETYKNRSFDYFLWNFAGFQVGNSRATATFSFEFPQMKRTLETIGTRYHLAADAQVSAHVHTEGIHHGDLRAFVIGSKHDHLSTENVEMFQCTPLGHIFRIADTIPSAWVLPRIGQTSISPSSLFRYRSGSMPEQDDDHNSRREPRNKKPGEEVLHFQTERKAIGEKGL